MNLLSRNISRRGALLRGTINRGRTMDLSQLRSMMLGKAPKDADDFVVVERSGKSRIS